MTNAEASLGPNQQANLQQLLQSRHLLQGASTQTQINTLADIGSATVANYAAYPKHAWTNIPAGATDVVESEAQARQQLLETVYLFSCLDAGLCTARARGGICFVFVGLMCLRPRPGFRGPPCSSDEACGPTLNTPTTLLYRSPAR